MTRLATTLLAFPLVLACGPLHPKLPESCSRPCPPGYPDPKGPDDTGECYCQAVVSTPQCAADDFVGIPCSAPPP